MNSPAVSRGIKHVISVCSETTSFMFTLSPVNGQGGLRRMVLQSSGLVLASAKWLSKQKQVKTTTFHTWSMQHASVGKPEKRVNLKVEANINHLRRDIHVWHNGLLGWKLFIYYIYLFSEKFSPFNVSPIITGAYKSGNMCLNNSCLSLETWRQQLPLI